jgi:methyltransferase
VDIGLKQQARMDHLVLPLTRVTLRIHNFDDEHATIYEAEAISKSTPRSEKGIYWGYDVRIAQNMKEVVKDYDLVMLSNHTGDNYALPQFSDPRVLNDQKVMIYFAGTDNIDSQIARDPSPKYTFEEAISKFDFGIHLAPTGVKQLRLEERMFLTLSKFSAFTV